MFNLRKAVQAGFRAWNQAGEKGASQKSTSATVEGESTTGGSTVRPNGRGAITGVPVSRDFYNAKPPTDPRPFAAYGQKLILPLLCAFTWRDGQFSEKPFPAIQLVKLGVVTGAEIELLNGTQARHTKASAALAKFCSAIPTRADQLRENREAVKQDLLDGKEEPTEILTGDQIAQRNAEYIRLLKEETGRVYSEALPLLRTIAARLGEKAAGLAARLEQAELAEHARYESKFGHPFLPSQTLITVGQLSWRFETLVPLRSSHLSPAAALQSLGIAL